MCIKSARPEVARLKGKFTLAAFLMALAGLPCELSAQQPASFTAGGKNASAGSFDQSVEKMMHDVGVPGMSLAIIENNRVVFYRTYGYKQAGEAGKVTGRTVFEACSLSKSFLVYAAFRLVDEGKLDLDKPLYQYADPGTALSHDPRYKLITARMVLSHSSGIENWKRNNNADVLEIMSNPGEAFIYSGTGHIYLANVIASITGESYEEYIQRLVIGPLGLKNSYVKFSRDSSGAVPREVPGDYATGHDGFGKAHEKWKNKEPEPASGNSTTAEDYAHLLLAAFDKKHLSAKSVNTMLQPVIGTNKDDSLSHYGTGFEIFYAGNDTIIAHGGDNTGYKAQAFYSVVHKKGFVFMTNSDRGKILTTALCRMATGLDIARYYKNSYPCQYPDHATSLLKTYREAGTAAVFTEAEKLKAQGSLDESTLYAVAWEFMDRERGAAKRLLEENLRLYPASATTYGFLAETHLRLDEYDQAYACFAKAKELGFQFWNLDSKLKECREKKEDAAKRIPRMTQVSGAGELIIRAEDYNTMQGIKLQKTSDTGGGMHVGFVDTGDWMNYRVNVSRAGTYAVAFRITSLKGGSRLQLRTGTKVLATVDIATTNGWSNWTTLTSDVELPAGVQTLNLYASAGGFTINWFKLLPVSAGAD